MKVGVVMDLVNQSYLPDYAIDYLIHLEKKGRKPSTIKRYTYDLAIFFKWIKKKNKEELTFDQWRQLTLEEYDEFFNFLKNEKEYSDKTLHKMFVILKRMSLYFNSLNKVATIPELLIELTDTQGKVLSEKDLISNKEFIKLIESMKSYENLSENQLKIRDLILDRNLSLVYMMYYEGLTISELTSIQMIDINFIQNTLIVGQDRGNVRKLVLPAWRKQQYYKYYKTIPEAVRPKMYSDEPFYCSFFSKLNTYKYVYEGLVPIRPKDLTEVSIQRMLQKEVKRAGLRKGISPQNFRNTAIVNSILKGDSESETMINFGLESEYSYKRYLKYVRSLKEAE